MTKLKRCPFCGGEAKTEQCEDITYNAKGKARIYPYTAVYCVDCGAKIEEQDEEELVDMWNTRTLEEIVRCWDCKEYDEIRCGYDGNLTSGDWFCRYGRVKNASTD